MKRYFFFMYPSEPQINSLLSLAIYALNPSEKWPPHVTVAGPFDKRPNHTAKVSGEVVIFCFGAANFFSQGLNTIFLKVGVKNIASVLQKPDFPYQPVPHLSLYNGRDHEFSRYVFSKMSAMNLNFAFRCNGLSLVSSDKSINHNLLRRQINLDYFISRTKPSDLEEIAKMDLDERVNIALSALRQCAAIGGPGAPKSEFWSESNRSQVNVSGNPLSASYFGNIFKKSS